MVKPKPQPEVMQWIASVDESLLHFSVVTVGEIRKGISSRPAIERKAQLETWLHELVSRFSERILAVDLAVADRWGRMAGVHKAKGLAIPVIDGLLAATALHYDLTLVTRNIKDVQGTGVELFNPWLL
jgi:hypothetical protein